VHDYRELVNTVSWDPLLVTMWITPEDLCITPVMAQFDKLLLVRRLAKEVGRRCQMACVLQTAQSCTTPAKNTMATHATTQGVALQTLASVTASLGAWPDLKHHPSPKLLFSERQR
jgi:hypothetical protein